MVFCTFLFNLIPYNIYIYIIFVFYQIVVAICRLLSDLFLTVLIAKPPFLSCLR